METTKAAAPTGCYKCGRPGHWSRDCPDSNPVPDPNSLNSIPSSSSYSNSKSFSFKPSYYGNNNSKSSSAEKPKPKPKKVPRSRPKLTPELLLGDDGLGYVLRYFPRHFKYGGRGHEVSNLGNLISLYSEWHCHLLPYYSFDQFVHKVEQVAATKRVKTCIRDLREKVANGGDLTKLHELPTAFVNPDNEQDISTPAEGTNTEEPLHMSDPSTQNHDADVTQEGMLHKTAEIAAGVVQGTFRASGSGMTLPNQRLGSNFSTDVQITEEQRARMEAHRLKALEKAAARSRSQH